MSAHPPRPWRELAQLRDEIAPGPPRSFATGYARHQRAEREASGAAIEAIRRQLPEGWRIGWAHTGGGCSAWEIFRDADEGAGPYVMLTGASESWDECTGNLQRGALLGLYESDGGEASVYVDVLTGAPLEIAREALQLVARAMGADPVSLR